MQIRMNDLDARVQRIERVLTNQSLLELAQRIDALQADLRTMRGEVELLQNETRGRQDAVAQSVWRSREAPGGARDAGRCGRARRRGRRARRRPRAAHREQATYDAGMAALRRRQTIDKAITTFREVVTNYPTSDLASNAQYWIGEATTPRAISKAPSRRIARCTTDWPDSRKAPDAMVKLGFTQSDLRRNGEARITLEDVVRQLSRHRGRAARRGSPEAPARQMTR